MKRIWIRIYRAWYKYRLSCLLCDYKGSLHKCWYWYDTQQPEVGELIDSLNRSERYYYDRLKAACGTFAARVYKYEDKEVYPCDIRAMMRNTKRCCDKEQGCG